MTATLLAIIYVDLSTKQVSLKCPPCTESFQSFPQAARHRYLCPGAGITPVLAASLPEEPSIDAQTGSKPNKQSSSFASMIGRVKREARDPCTTFRQCSCRWALTAHSSNQINPRFSPARRACDPSMCCPRFSSNGGASSERWMFEDSCVRI